MPTSRQIQASLTEDYDPRDLGVATISLGTVIDTFPVADTGAPNGGSDPASAISGGFHDGALAVTAEPKPLEENVPPHGLQGGAVVSKRRRSSRSRSLNDRRYHITVLLIGVVAALAAGGLVFLAIRPDSSNDTVREYLAITFGPLVTLLGTSFAWFFASSEREALGSGYPGSAG